LTEAQPHWRRAYDLNTLIAPSALHLTSVLFQGRRVPRVGARSRGKRRGKNSL